MLTFSSEFTWCDLSTFRVATALAFYKDLFGWSFISISQPDGTPYQIATTGQGEAAGLFEMWDTRPELIPVAAIVLGGIALCVLWWRRRRSL